jgi:hypothetical protein
MARHSLDHHQVHPQCQWTWFNLMMMMEMMIDDVDR